MTKSQFLGKFKSYQQILSQNQFFLFKFYAKMDILIRWVKWLFYKKILKLMIF